jgi:hypothetical protein
MGQVSHFLGIEFTWHHSSDGNVSVNLTQQSFTENLLESLGHSTDSVSTFTTPYQSGISIDTIPNADMSVFDHDKLRLQFQSLGLAIGWPTPRILISQLLYLFLSNIRAIHHQDI